MSSRSALSPFTAAPILIAASLFPYISASSPIAVPGINSRSGTSTESFTYIMPIWEGALASHNRSDDVKTLSAMKNRLGSGGSHTKLGWSFSSWSLSRDSETSFPYNFDPTNLKYNLGLAVESNLPILVHMNNGRWADCCTPNSSGGWGDTLLDYIAEQPNTTALNSAGQSLYGHNFGSNYFSLSRLNTVYRSYKKRNVQAAARIAADHASSYPALFVGISLDSETVMPNNAADFNPLVIEEWRHWLQNTGIYGPGGDFFDNHARSGRVPAFTTIEPFNRAMGTSFASWSALQPPSPMIPGEAFSEEWERWRITLIDHAVADETLWIASVGISSNLVYGHQTPQLGPYSLADDVQTLTAANGASGVTNYGWNPSDFGRINNIMRGSGKNNIGNFELNPLSGSSSTAYMTLLTLYNDGMRIVCPNAWESDQSSPDQFALVGSPYYGDAFGNGIQQFLEDHGNSPRNLQPPPYNPGELLFDLYDLFPSAISSGPDNHLEAAGSVGNVVRKCVYSAVGGSVTYRIPLPKVPSGQRLNFWTSLGIKDGAGSGGDSTFQVTINGASNLFGSGIVAYKNYWIWKRWIPVMVDITPWAGSTITLKLTTTGNDYYGWTTWGSPAIYQSTTGNDLAAGKTVTVSSADRGWNPRYLTSSNTDGGMFDGWSSDSHASAAAIEYARVDLGSSQNVGKVVLFSRSDLSDAQGTGFPVDFKIQGSTDATTWMNLVVETNYPGAKAGDGQIFTFPGQSVRYIQVNASKLSGVGGERGYRFQLEHFQVYP